jgi:flagellar basal-body rod protein FlgB
MWNNMFSSVDLLQKGTNAAWLRNEVISNNIANVDTPDFKRSDVQFESLLDQEIAMSGVNARADNLNAVIVVDNSDALGLDGNNVDIEKEMTELAKNSIEYYTYVSKINSEFKKLEAAINVI